MELASRMSAHGFRWQPNRVAQLETLRRPVALPELIGLSWAFSVPVGRFFAGDEDVALPDGRCASLARLRETVTSAN